MAKIYFKKDGLLFVFRKGKTTNRKISAGDGEIVQTYTFSREQFEHIANGGQTGGLWANDQKNCLDCPFRGNDTNGSSLKGKCYTHKGVQAMGFASMLRSIARNGHWAEIPDMPDNAPAELVEWCKDTYVRFGTYGEPSLIPFQWVASMAAVAKSWTGYTHQWAKPWAQPYSAYLMASCHNNFEAAIAADMGWRSFVAVSEKTGQNISCPASKESGYISHCAKCALCGGTEGKGKKSVEILMH